MEDIEAYQIGQPGACITLYKNLFPSDQNYAERLEAVLTEDDPFFRWNNARVGFVEEMLDYRDCSDFKYGGTKGAKFEQFTNPPEQFADAREVHDEVMGPVHACVEHYCENLNIGTLEYFEAPNFVRYNKGQHFQVHPDCGFSYTCTTSVVAFFNTCGEDYTGGELVFPYQDIKFTPHAGDMVVFPSNYPYVHQSLPIETGTKYSLVVMYDYNDLNHRSDNLTLETQIGIEDATGQIQSASS